MEKSKLHVKSINYLFLLIILLSCVSCNPKHVYTRPDIPKNIKQLCKNEYNIDVTVWDENDTIWIYAPIELVNAAGKLNQKENGNWNDDVMRKLQRISTSINRVFMNTDNRPNFYCLIRANTKKIGADWYTLVFIPDEIRHSLRQRSVPFLPSTALAKKTVSFLTETPLALKDLAGKHVHPYNVHITEFLSLLAELSLQHEFSKKEKDKSSKNNKAQSKPNYTISEITAKIKDQTFFISFDIVQNEFSHNIPRITPKIKKIITFIVKSYDSFYPIKKVVLTDIFHDKTETIRYKPKTKLRLDTQINEPENKHSLLRMSHATQLITQAQKKYENKKYNLAKELYSQALKSYPQHLLANTFLGMSYCMLDDPDQAIPLFEYVTQTAPNYSNGFYGLGLAYSMKKDFPNATLQFKKAIAVNKDDVTLNLNLAYAYYNMGNYQTANTHAQKIIDSSSLKITSEIRLSAYNILAESYSMMNDKVSAQEYFYKIIDNPVKTLEGKLTLGQAYKNTGQFQKALDIFNEISYKNPDNLAVKYSLAQTYILMDMPSDALNEYEYLLEKDSEKKEYIYLEIANIFYKLKDTSRYTNNLRLSLNINPDNINTNYLLGQFYLHVKEYLKARGYFEHIITIDTTIAEAYYGLALVNFFDDKLLVAKDLFLKAQKMFIAQGNFEEAKKIDTQLNDLPQTTTQD